MSIFSPLDLLWVTLIQNPPLDQIQTYSKFNLKSNFYNEAFIPKDKSLFWHSYSSIEVFNAQWKDFAGIDRWLRTQPSLSIDKNIHNNKEKNNRNQFDEQKCKNAKNTISTFPVSRSQQCFQFFDNPCFRTLKIWHFLPQTVWLFRCFECC